MSPSRAAVPLAPSLCHGWSALDFIVHVRTGLEEMAIGAVPSLRVALGVETARMMVSVPVPRLPRWFALVALGGWLVGLAVASFVRTHWDQSFWPTFTADVIGTFASLAFALTGAAALVSRWEYQKLLVETAQTTVLELNLTHTRVRQGIEELLETIRSVVPLVSVADPDALAKLLCYSSGPKRSCAGRAGVQRARAESDTWTRTT